MAKEVGVEWINLYDCHNPLGCEDQDAEGFYYELVNHDGWVGNFNWGDGNAWERDFKRPDKGGTADYWVDAADFVYFTGHGGPFVAAYFRCDVPDDDRLEADHYYGPNNGDLRLGRQDLEWIAFEVCNTLQYEADAGGTTYDVFDRWADTFEGLHIMCSFTTTSLDLCTPGKYFAALCDGRWPSVIFGFPSWMIGRRPMKVIDTWFNMTSLTQPDWAEAAVMYANTEGTDTQNDYIHSRPRPCEPRSAARGRELVLLDLGYPSLLSNGALVMKTIRIFRQRVKRLDAERISAIGKALGATGEVVETEEAIALIDKEGAALAYAQPGAKFGGLLFFSDAAADLGSIADRPAEAKRALDWSRKFLDSHDLLPETTKEDEIRVDIDFKTRTPEAVVFDGRERKNVTTRLDVFASLSLDDVPVTGPRGKLRLSFKSDERPIAVHRGLWEDLEIFEERAYVSEDAAVRTVRERLAKRTEKGTLFRLVTVRQAYWAKEYEGGVDLLEPYHFVEVEFEDRAARKHGIEQGPRQIFTVPGSQ